MKIYYVAHARMPNERAYGIQLAKMCEAFVEAGITLELILPTIPNTSKETIREFYSLSADIPVTYLPVLNFGTSALAFNLRALSFAFSSYLYLRKRKKVGEKGIIYTIDLDQFSFFLLPLLRLPVYAEIHGSKRKNILTSFFFKNVSGIIAVSEGVRKNMCKIYGLPEDRVIALPNANSLSSFDFSESTVESRQKLGLPEDKKIFLYSGKFYDWKGLDIFVEVAHTLPHILFYFIGGTYEEFKVATGIDDIPKNIVCMGHQDFKKMPLWLSSADFFLLSGTKRDHYSYYETSPMKLFEYAGAKRPVIAARTPAIENAVSNLDVLFYEPDNARSLVEQIRYVLESPAELRVISEHLFEKAKSFSWLNRARTVIKFIESRV